MQKENFIPYQREAFSVMKYYKSEAAGLTSENAARRLKSYGQNIIQESEKQNPLKKILIQFKSPMMVILVIAFIISLGLKENIDAWVIFTVIILNALVGFIHEYRVERAINALKKMSTPFAKVFRDGLLKMIKTPMIVPGDIIFLEEGDRVPADGRIIESKNLKVMESVLTGESLSSDKSSHTIHTKLPLADRKNMVFMGTFVTSGNGKFLVTETGENTAFGRIAKSLGGIKQEESLFTKKINTLSKQAGIAAIVLSAIIFSYSLFINKLPFRDTFLVSMASLVSIIPEGMIALFSIILAIGAKRMAKKRALIKNLTATEGVGAITTIITDKTGTLTQNIMMVESIRTATQEVFGVSGSGWDSIGFFHQNAKIIDAKLNKALSKILRIIAICNSAKVRKGPDSEYDIIGEPTEAALIVAANKAGLTQELLLAEEFKIDEPTFDSVKKHREVLVETKEGERYIYIVGAPEKVLEKCGHYFDNGRSLSASKEKIESIKKDIEELADAGLRTIAAAYKKVDKKTYKVDTTDAKDMVYVGTAGLKDPLRAGVKEAILRANAAGIRVIMATGDHKRTAVAIAKEIGLDFHNATSEEELLGLTDSEFENIALTHSVFARVSPTTKLRIAEILQKNGEIVAMTGDGVNDAPALKKADVGIAMGKIGTDVARESAQIILTDDNFTTIIDAIEEGRLVFRNVQKTGAFLLSTNFAEGITILSTMAMGLPLPLLPTQILWLNLVTDSLAGFPLAGELAHEDLLKERPKSFQENILSKRTLPFMILMVVVMVVGAILIFKATLPLGIEKARTLAFLFIAFSQLFNVMNLRSLEKSVFKMNPFSNVYLVFGLGAALLANILVVYLADLRNIFHLEAVSLKEFLVILAISFSIIIFAEIYKVLKRKFRNTTELV